MYDIVLARPIAQGEVTRLRYPLTGDTAYFRYLAGDVNRDGTSTPADILAVIDCLNGVANFDCRLSNTDVDRSNETGPPDILRVVDLLNGAAEFESWLGVQLGLTGCEIAAGCDGTGQSDACALFDVPGTTCNSSCIPAGCYLDFDVDGFLDDCDDDIPE